MIDEERSDSGILLEEYGNKEQMLISMIDDEYWLNLYRMQRPFILKQKANKV